jgi:hypothetical protein
MKIQCRERPADSLALVRHVIDDVMNGRTFTADVRRLDASTRSVSAIDRVR